MDELDETILAALIDGKPRSLHQLLKKMGPLPQHPEAPPRQPGGPGTRDEGKSSEKVPEGRVSPTLFVLERGVVLGPLSEVDVGVVTLPFSRLGQVCRFEKGGFCKKIRAGFEAWNCPQINKWG